MKDDIRGRRFTVILLAVVNLLASSARGQHILVSSLGTDEVLRYSGTTGQFLGVFVRAGTGGLHWPEGLTFGPDGFLYVSSALTNSILHFNPETGGFMGPFVSSGSGGLA